MNLVYQVVPSENKNGMQVMARIRAVNQELRAAIQGAIEAAVAEGVRVGRAEAPRGLEFHEGNRISDAIVGSPVVYHPGGAGGGGFYEASVQARSDIAPHLRYVYEGTGERGIEDRGLIRPTHGNVMVIQKHGEETAFARWSRGQFPQQRWWEITEERVGEMVSESVRGIA